MGQDMTLPTHLIEYVEGCSNYTLICTSGGKKYLVCRTIKQLYEHLGDSFIRVHKGFLVNKRRISTLLKTQMALRLEGGVLIPISRRKYAEVTQEIARIAL